GHVGYGEFDADARNELDCGEPGVHSLAGTPKQFNGMIDILYGDKGSFHLMWPRKQLKRRRSNNPESPFRSNEEMLQVVARIVLPQSSQPVPYLTIRQNHLEA